MPDPLSARPLGGRDEASLSAAAGPRRWVRACAVRVSSCNAGRCRPARYGPITAFWTALPDDPSAVSSSNGRLGAVALVYFSTPFW